MLAFGFMAVGRHNCLDLEMGYIEKVEELLTFEILLEEPLKRPYTHISTPPTHPHPHPQA